jgi:hypothetical protein
MEPLIDQSTPPSQTLLAGLTPAEQQAVRLLALALDSYNSFDGTGLFTGISRYEILEGRVHLTAVQARSLFEWWALLLRKMVWPAPTAAPGAQVLPLLQGEDADEVLRVLAAETPAVMMLARALHDEGKQARKAVRG